MIDWGNLRNYLPFISFWAIEYDVGLICVRLTNMHLKWKKQIVRKIHKYWKWFRQNLNFLSFKSIPNASSKRASNEIFFWIVEMFASMPIITRSKKGFGNCCHFIRWNRSSSNKDGKQHKIWNFYLSQWDSCTAGSAKLKWEFLFQTHFLCYISAW